MDEQQTINYRQWQEIEKLTKNTDETAESIDKCKKEIISFREQLKAQVILEMSETKIPNGTKGSRKERKKN